jgi:hypothetical protein
VIVEIIEKGTATGRVAARQGEPVSDVDRGHL